MRFGLVVVLPPRKDIDLAQIIGCQARITFPTLLSSMLCRYG
ncbi:MAG: hypothetical protein N0E48_13640 [Candidatus Thiodiazotropha endolucinida]|nr:hypothetical protein [Candidatus Thiodiazotropha endolucinida]